MGIGLSIDAFKIDEGEKNLFKIIDSIIEIEICYCDIELRQKLLPIQISFIGITLREFSSWLLENKK